MPGSNSGRAYLLKTAVQARYGVKNCFNERGAMRFVVLQLIKQDECLFERFPVDSTLYDDVIDSDRRSTAKGR